MELEKYVDKLPEPKILKPKRTICGKKHYSIVMKEILQKLHRDLPPTKLWGYEGSYPGPTIEVQKDEPITVTWINDLPTYEHLLPVDTTIHGAEPPNPPVRTVVHLHGGHVPPVSDGFPEAWFTNSNSQVGPDFKTNTYCYPNIQPSTCLWYHDHAVGITRLNVYAGLAGFYIIRDKQEKELKLPKGKYEIPLVIQDKAINDDGSLYYPSEPEPPVPDVFPSIVPEFFGNIIVVNGKAWPYVEVEPRLYRLRLLNGSNSRFYTLQFDASDGKRPDWVQIGTDGGLLENPVNITELTLAPAERADVLVDFTGLEGLEFILTNSAPIPFPNGEGPDENTGQIMKFKIGTTVSDYRNNTIPQKLVEVKRLDPDSARKVRDLTLVETTDEFDRLMLLLTGQLWTDPITENPLLNTAEIWRFINLTPDTHPIHLHLVQFQILERRPFNVDYYNATGEILFTGPSRYPDSNERGWKDTVRANPGEITSIIACFKDFTGVYPWHCHILEHEDHEMMRPYRVVKETNKITDFLKK
ncbi:spore coat protein A [Clostridiales bacterium oral taxon 876 str. F0540]|nr:spore coat protein A [Clostridiales bacterium oral taxon 876 str. F0540]